MPSAAEFSSASFWRLACSSRCRVCASPVMSWTVPTIRTTWPASSLIVVPRAWITRSTPPGRTTRHSRSTGLPAGDGVRARGFGPRRDRRDGWPRSRPRRWRRSGRGHSQDAVELRRPGHLVGDDVPLPAAQRRELLRVGELRLAAAHSLVGRDAHADVAREGGRADDPARVVADRRHRDRDVDPAPVLGHPLRVDLADDVPWRTVSSRLPDPPRRSGGTSMPIDSPSASSAGVAVEPLRRRVPVRDQPGEGEADDRVLG